MIATLLAKLIEAGTPADLIAEVAMELGKAAATAEMIEGRRAKDRERKRSVPRNSTESTESEEPQEKGSLEVSPQTPLPNLSKNSPPISPRDRVELPDWMPPSYSEFRAMRKSMRNVPFGPGAERRVVAKIAKLRAEGHDPEKLLSKAIERGNRTVFEDESTRAAFTAKPKSDVDWAERAQFYERIGKKDQADECRRKVVPIGQLANDLLRRAG